MRTHYTAISSDRQVLGVWLDDKEVAAWHADYNALRATELAIMDPADRYEWGNSLIQSAMAAQFMKQRAQDKITMFGELYGFAEHRFVHHYAKKDAELTKKTYLETLHDALEKMELFNGKLAQVAKVTHTIHDEMHFFVDDMAQFTEVLNVWKKPKSDGGTPPNEGSRKGGAEGKGPRALAALVQDAQAGTPRAVAQGVRACLSSKHATASCPACRAGVRLQGRAPEALHQRARDVRSLQGRRAQHAR